MAGERRLHGNASGFTVADLTHQDDVRVVTQNGAQAAGEGEPFFIVDRNLQHAVELVLHGIFNGDNFAFTTVEFAEC